MTKQGEIREGIELILDNLIEGNKIRMSTSNMVGLYREKLVSYLKSQGVVLKVYREMPYINRGRNKGQNEAQLDMRDRMLKAGFTATEDLI
ncbi:hypothetical protein LCGC14_2474850 [marine sediment metagenome]|uniref:Uncharacterized protein n=1 Tax=marine sediment metagenome TaxID=412755 RepID=A0A0F9B971_9ZZZZ